MSSFKKHLYITRVLETYILEQCLYKFICHNLSVQFESVSFRLVETGCTKERHVLPLKQKHQFAVRSMWEHVHRDSQSGRKGMSCELLF